ncbi:hypothetical protein V2H77_02345 [Photorhabdus sp. P32]|uniref:hypothetical protein n=1 Tax=Photorhabdus TaxID=29487 RepID=UPI00223D7DE4|nr:hypothetical protein [Photorhabdus aballayi]MCW7549814.1 hypothetical protein [Photorhabdus aballayi]
MVRAEGQTAPGRDFVATMEVTDRLNKIAFSHPLPVLSKTDNGSEFAGKILDKWTYKRNIRIDFSVR